ncbi:DUF459 domain-containing protein [Brucella sp. IR073]|uniref:SGNH/GDSL hydrolase family protein n=1 Tax=unclassified Brucella TaxID=2632610 RepID=UPI003B982E86
MRQRPASFLTLVLILLSLAALTILAVTPEAAAQERRNLFEMLFGRRTPPPVYEEPPQYREPGRARKRPSKSATRRRPPSERPAERPMRSRAPAATGAPSARAAAAPTPPVEKTPDARTVLVVGDFIGGGLAEGLSEAFAETPDIRVASRINGSSGFVRTDHYDWGTNIKTILEEERPAAVVVMIGANDRQPMTVDGVTYAPRTPQWTAEYSRRVESFVGTVKSAGYPLVWVGQPPFKLRSLSQDMLALNEIYQTATENAGGNFTDVWDGFVDENGNFVLSGVDINGQTARLRANDGINITSAGKRKLAFYAEKPLRQLLGATTPAPLPGTPAGPNAPTAAAPAKIDRIAPVSLKDLDLQGSNELMGAAVGPVPAKPAPDNTVTAHPGRADDFRWPR